ncbi:MAG: hypothetical protein H7X97_00340 [Opitutaceae bacterium]|nr:hypothetical protein [Verrucomicrobiales bacterium]
MKLITTSLVNRVARRGYALIFALLFTGVSLLILGSALAWSSASSRLTARSNLYYGGVNVVEASAEKVIARMTADFQTNGQATVDANLGSYATYIPTTTETSLLKNYQFNNGTGTINRVKVDKLVNWTYTNLPTIYNGLMGRVATFQITATALDTNAVEKTPVAIQRQAHLASIPIFNFACYYAVDMEFNPGGAMTVNGRVHGNGNIYLQPGNGLTFQTHVTSARKIHHNYHPNDPRGYFTPTITYNALHDGGVNSMTLPIGTNNTSTNLHRIIEVPPSTAVEPTNSAMGRMRYYNKADLIILISNTTVVARSGSYNNFATVLPWTNVCDRISVTKKKKKGAAVTNVVQGVIATNVVFYDKRAGQYVNATEVDVSELINDASFYLSWLGRSVKTLYVADFRTTAGRRSVVRIVNGQVLPSAGLTIVSPNPVYIQGEYNVPDAYLGTTNTSASAPASIIGDAVTVLSDDWSDAASGGDLSGRLATNMTINAAILTGVPVTAGGAYSGGMENFLRLLEDWSGKTLTFNGSMVALFQSQAETTPLYFPTTALYAAPTRNWNFNPALQDPAKQPPGTPELRVLIRGDWRMVRGAIP